MVTETEILFYELENGKSPFIDWLEHLADAKTISRIRARIDTMETGNWGDYKPVTGAQGLYEARLDFGPGYRLYFAIKRGKGQGKIEQQTITILNAGSKRTQDRDIKRAKNYLDDL